MKTSFTSHTIQMCASYFILSLWLYELLPPNYTANDTEESYEFVIERCNSDI